MPTLSPTNIPNILYLNFKMISNMAENVPLIIQFITECLNTADSCSKNSTIYTKLNHSDFGEKKAGALELVKLTENNEILQEA